MNVVTIYLMLLFLKIDSYNVMSLFEGTQLNSIVVFVIAGFSINRYRI